MDEWVAFRRIEPGTDELLRQLTETLKYGIRQLCATQGMEITPDELDFSRKAPDDRSQPQQDTDGTMSPEQGAAVASTRLGPPDKRH